jgi:phosphoribosyl 1,2-cyclic phosphate phosphodiesterase
MFSYIFAGDYKYGGIAQVELNTLDGPLELHGVRFEPIAVMHGDAEICGFRFGSAAYLTDFSEIPEPSMARLHGLDILFLDALRHKPHPTHSTVENSLGLIERLKPRRAFFTHISHDLGHEETNAKLPANVRLSHDGLKLEFEL